MQKAVQASFHSEGRRDITEYVAQHAVSNFDGFSVSLGRSQCHLIAQRKFI